MRIPLYFAALLFLVRVTPVYSQSHNLPTYYVKCVEDDASNPIASRTEQTPVAVSKQHYRAYGVVTARLVSPRGCSTTSNVYVDNANGTSKSIFEQGPEQTTYTHFQDSGIRRLDWSPNGEWLLVEIVQWPMGDCCERIKYFLFKPDGTPHSQIDPERVIVRSFKQDCSYQIESDSWLDSNHIKLTVKPFKNFDEEGIPYKSPSCVVRDTSYSFDIRDAAISRLTVAKHSSPAKNLQR